MKTEKFPIDSLGKRIPYPIDVFICCGSYEDRCRSVADRVEPEKISHALVVENKNLSIYVGENSKYIRERFGSKTVDVATDSSDPIITADNLQDAVKSLITDKPQKFLIDITTFRHESLLILLNLLKRMLKKKDEIYLLYVSAADYSIGDNKEDKWLSKGVTEVRTILGYTGDITPSKKMHLIVLVGFEYQRASRLIEILEPSCLSLGHGVVQSATDEKHIAAQEFFYDLLSKMMMRHGRVDKFEFYCNDPEESKKSILAQASKYFDHNVIVAPMNTKLSTVGAALASFENSEIQVCYAQADYYNYHGYSLPGNSCYMFQFCQ